MVRLISPREGEMIALQTAQQQGFKGNAEGGDVDWLALRKTDSGDYTQPLKAEFAWESDSDEDTLELAEEPSFSACRRVSAAGGRAATGNLRSGQTYCWRVSGSEVRSFVTADSAPRWIEVSGLSNVRDMGAWRAMDGMRIRQGLLYRGSEMDTHHTITPEGIRVMREELGIRTDLDLRGEAVGRVTESPLGGDIRFMLVPAKAYAEFMTDDQKPVCRRLFEILADEENYPIYFHCWGGADRTGTLALMLEAVLGVSEADMLRDYELTSLSIWGDRSRKSELFVSLMDALAEYGGDTLNERVLAYLASCGVTDEVIARLRHNLLEMPR